jgi:hypothetical protein
LLKSRDSGAALALGHGVEEYGDEMKDQKCVMISHFPSLFLKKKLMPDKH